MFLLLINFLQTVFDVIMDALTLLRLMFRSNGSARRQESLSAQTYGAVHRMRWAESALRPFSRFTRRSPRRSEP